MLQDVPIDDDALAGFCRTWGIVELALFGSAVHGPFKPDSDVDVIVTFGPDVHPTLLQMVDMQDQLERLFRRPVDLLSKSGVLRSGNPIRRRAILDSAQVLYAAA